MKVNTEAQWEQLMEYIETYIQSPRKEALIKM